MDHVTHFQYYQKVDNNRDFAPIITVNVTGSNPVCGTNAAPGNWITNQLNRILEINNLTTLPLVSGGQ